MTDEKKLTAIKLLQEKYNILQRMPQKTDFDSKTVCFIKQKLGPWPRALEQAGLKIQAKESAKDKSKAKRERIKTNKK